MTKNQVEVFRFLCEILEIERSDALTAARCERGLNIMRGAILSPAWALERFGVELHARG